MTAYFQPKTKEIPIYHSVIIMLIVSVQITDNLQTFKRLKKNFSSKGAYYLTCNVRNNVKLCLSFFL